MILLSPDSQEIETWQEACHVFPSGRGETPGESDVTTSGHKQPNWKVQGELHSGRDGATLPSNNNHVIFWPRRDLGDHSGPDGPESRTDDTSDNVHYNLPTNETGTFVIAAVPVEFDPFL